MMTADNMAMPNPTETTVGVVLSLGKLNEKTAKGWKLTSQNLGEGYKQGIGGHVVFGHSEEAEVAGHVRDIAIENGEIMASLALSRKALARNNIKPEDLPKDWSDSVEWLMYADNITVEKGTQTHSYQDALRLGLIGYKEIGEGRNEIFVKDSDATMLVCDPVFTDIALLDKIAGQRPNFPSARIVAATNQAEEATGIESLDKNSEQSVVIEPQIVVDNETMMKTEAGVKFSASAYAYCPDPQKPSTWKIRLEETPGKVTKAQLGRAAAAMSAGGFRGNTAIIPADKVGAVKSKIRAEYRKLGVAKPDMPEAVRNITLKEVIGMKIPENEAELQAALDAANEAGRETVIESPPDDLKARIVAEYEEKTLPSKIETAVNSEREKEKTAREVMAQLNAIHPVTDDERDVLDQEIRAEGFNLELAKERRENKKLQAENEVLKTARLSGNNSAGGNSSEFSLVGNSADTETTEEGQTNPLEII